MNRKYMLTIIMLLLVSLTACSRDEAIRVDNLDVKLETIEYLEIRYPGRKRINTDVIVEQGDKASISGWIGSYDLDDNTLRIELNGNLRVTLPPAHALKDLDIGIASGIILVEGLEDIVSLDTRSAAGNIKLLGLSNIMEIDAESAAGRITIEAGGTGKARLKTVSGDISFRGDAEYLAVETVASDARIYTDSTVDLDFKSVTGRNSFKGTTGNEMRIDVKTTTGNLYIDRLNGTGSNR